MVSFISVAKLFLQIFHTARENLQNVMDGYCVGEPYFSQRLQENVNTLMQALKDPALPLLELQVSYLLSFTFNKVESYHHWVFEMIYLG